MSIKRKLFSKLKNKKRRILYYLTYCVIEIALIVIGILIALGMDNRNNKSINAINTKNAVVQIYDQVGEDIVFIDDYLEKLKIIENSFKMYFGKPYDSKQVSKSIFILNLTELQLLDLNDRCTNLINNSDFYGTRYTIGLNKLTSAYKSFGIKLQREEQMMINHFEKFHEYLVEQDEWYVDFLNKYTCNHECLSFLNDDAKAKSIIARLNWLYSTAYHDELQAFSENLKANKDYLRILMESDNSQSF